MTVKVKEGVAPAAPSATRGPSMDSAGPPSGVPVASIDAGPSCAPVRVGITRTRCCTPGARPPTVWLVPVVATSRDPPYPSVPDRHCTLYPSAPVTALHCTCNARMAPATVNPPGAASASSSATVAVRLATTPVYSLAVAVPAVWVSTTDSSAASASSPARAVTLCAVLHVVGVKRSVACTPFDASPSVSSIDTAPASALDRTTVTACVGGVERETAYCFAPSVAWPSVSASGPVSTAPVDGSASTTTAGVSSSSTVTDRLAMAREAG